MTQGREGCQGCFLNGSSEIDTIHTGDLVVFDPKAVPRRFEPVIMLDETGLCARLYNEPLHLAKTLALEAFVKPDNFIGVIVASLTFISQQIEQIKEPI